MAEESYKHGIYCIREDVPYADAVRTFIESFDFRDRSQYEPIPTTNRRNKLYSFHFAPADRRMVVKFFSADPALPRRRRAALFMTNLAKNYARASYAGARILEQAGIPGARAIAYWTFRPDFQHMDGYYLYEEIPAKTSVYRFRESIRGAPSLLERRAWDRMIDEIAHISRTLHEHNIRHGALELGNFLVDFGNHGARPRNDADADNARLYLMDTDRVSKARLRLPGLKRFLDLNCLRRFDFDRAGRRAFVGRYLGEHDSVLWWYVLELWRLRRFRLRSQQRGSTSALQPR